MATTAQRGSERGKRGRGGERLRDDFGPEGRDPKPPSQLIDSSGMLGQGFF